MKYDFDQPVNRRGTNCVKWDEHEDVIPLWVADMDFRVAPAIQKAVEQRAAQGIYGYTLVPEAYYQSVISWFHRRHNWDIRRADMLYTTGVVPAISCVIKALTLPGEKVLMLTPVYNCFFSSIRNNGCEVLESELEARGARYEVRGARCEVRGARYEVNWQDFEEKCADEKTSVFLLCNPHNPVGRVWTRPELQQLSDICHRHGVTIISDEIHGELIMPGQTFVPMGTVTADAIVCNSPSKSFNTAGLQMANIICRDPALRRRIARAININEVCDVNPFAPPSVMAAYDESEEWLDQLCLYIYHNYKALVAFMADRLPQLSVTPLEGTYLAWVDVSALGLSSDALTGQLLQRAHVQVSSGTLYGAAGEGFIRINLACPRAQLMEGLERINNSIKNR
jgi:cystathionine beta-lyase